MNRIQSQHPLTPSTEVLFIRCLHCTSQYVSLQVQALTLGANNRRIGNISAKN